jgi:hypothetical protein
VAQALTEGQAQSLQLYRTEVLKPILPAVRDVEGGLGGLLRRRSACIDSAAFDSAAFGSAAFEVSAPQPASFWRWFMRGRGRRSER